MFGQLFGSAKVALSSRSPQLPIYSTEKNDVGFGIWVVPLRCSQGAFTVAPLLLVVKPVFSIMIVLHRRGVGSCRPVPDGAVHGCRTGSSVPAGRACSPGSPRFALSFSSSVLLYDRQSNTSTLIHRGFPIATVSQDLCNQDLTLRGFPPPFSTVIVTN